MQYPNGVTTSYNYDALNRLTQMGAASGATPLSSYAYTLDAAGNRIAVTELSGRTVSYGYDDLYRLTSETIAGATSQNGTISYQYDAVGNRTNMSSTVPAVPPGVFFYDANDRLTTDVYDNDGNTVSSGGTSDVYDFENHLIQHGAVTIVYDGDGNRVSGTVGGVTTNYLVDTQNPTGYAQVVVEKQNGSVTRRYAWGLELISKFETGSSKLSFYGYDGHGSVRQLFSSTGAITDTYDYDAFGNLISQTGSTPNNYLFAGEQFDPALGLYYNRARYLNTNTGRFLTGDTFEGRLHDALSLHKYLYAVANPLNNRDQSGHEIDLVEATAVQSIQTGLATAQANFGFATAEQILTGGDAGLRSEVSQGAISLSEAFGTLAFVATFAAVVVGGFIASDWTTDKGKVYRGLANGEDPRNGLIARNPNASNSPTSHVAGKRDTRWISTTKDPEVAFNKYGDYGVVEIDLSKVNTQVIDLSSGLPDVPSDSMLNNFVRADSEVLIEKEIPADAIRIIESIE